MAYTYDPIFAADPSNAANVAASASITIFDPNDPSKAPVAITDVTGSPLPNPITVNAKGFGPAFKHATLDRVGWFGAGFSNFFTAYEGMKDEAVAARQAAESAASQAGAAAEADLAARIAAGQFKGAPGKDGSNVLPTDDAIEQAVKTPGTKTAAALSATYATNAALTPKLDKAEAATTYAKAGGAKAANGIFAAVYAALKSGRSTAVQLQGDSTGNATYEWFYLTILWLASLVTGAHVKYKLWNDTLQAYDPWSVVQAGTSGERYAKFLGANITRTFYTPRAAIPHISGDIDIRARLVMDDWTPSATAGIVTRYGAAGARAWKLSINSGGSIDFTWTTDGTTNIQKVSNALGFADGTEGWVRVTLDVDNGAGGYTWNAYKSTDGVTWTNVGTSNVTTGGATSIFDAAQEYEIGGRGFVGEPWSGKMYEVQIRDGIDGKIVNPQPIDSWVPRIASGAYVAGTFGGSPTLYVLNGSMPGAAYTYFSDTTRHPKMVHPYTGSLLFQSCSHNDGDNTAAAYLASRDAWLALNDARVPGSQTVVVTQNPEQAPIGAELINNQGRRRLLLMSWASRKGIAAIDTYKAFEDDTRGLTALLEADGIHPNTVGSQVWADSVTKAFGAAL